MLRAPFGYLSLCLVATLATTNLPGAARAQARVASIDGALLVRSGTAEWRALKVDEPIPAEKLIVALPQAEFVSANGAVRGLLLADVGHRTPYPVLEAGLTMHAPGDADLDLSLDRGIVGFMNAKPAGAARIKLRFRDQRWQLTLKSPDTRVGIEIYSRHVPGLRRVLEDKNEEPVTNVVCLVMRGQAFIELGDHGYALQAPPGTAQMLWDTATRLPEFHELDKVPPSLRDLSEKDAALFKELCAATSRLTQGKPFAAIGQLIASPQRIEHLAGVTAAGALDDLPHLLGALADSARSDVRDHAVLVLRHWLGRAPGQVALLYQALRQHGFTEAHARTILQLLFGFNDAERREPATYDLLLGYLDHSQLPVRQLAHWHLVRLAPAGREIVYDPAAAPAERVPAIRAWRGVIPEGGLPRRPTEKKTS